jgi:hypothetical protein
VSEIVVQVHPRSGGSMAPTHSYPFLDQPSGSIGAPLEEEGFTGELSMAQIQQLSENAGMVKDREKEILHITKSIVSLNSLFKGNQSLLPCYIIHGHSSNFRSRWLGS